MSNKPKLNTIHKSCVKMVGYITHFELRVKTNGKLADPKTKVVFYVTMDKLTKEGSMLVHGVYDPGLNDIREKSGWKVLARNIDDVTRLVGEQVKEFLLKGEVDEQQQHG